MLFINTGLGLVGRAVRYMAQSSRVSVVNIMNALTSVLEINFASFIMTCKERYAI